MHDIRFITSIAYDYDTVQAELELWGNPEADCWHLVQYDSFHCQTQSFLDQDSPVGGGLCFCSCSDAEAVRYVSIGRSWRRLSQILRSTVPDYVWPKYDEQLHREVRAAVLESRHQARKSAASRTMEAKPMES